MNELSAHGVALLAFTAVVFAIFVRDRVPIATVCLGILALLPLGFALAPLETADGPVDPLRFFAGFGHPALVAICALMIVGQGIVATGALEPLARRLAGWVAASPRAAMLAVLVGAAAASGVVNDTPVVVLLIPLLLAASRRAKVAASGLLMPMNFAVLMGGMATTIGTSTNLIVVAIAASLGVGAIGMFSFLPLVALAAVPGLLYLWLVAPRWLAGVKTPEGDLSDDAFDAELHVEADSGLVGRQLHDALALTGRRLRPLALLRGEHELALLPSRVLRAGDRLRVRDTVANLKEYEDVLKARLHRVAIEPDDEASEASAGAAAGGDGAKNGAKNGAGSDDAGKDERPRDDPAALPSAVVAQLVVTPESPLVGQSVRDRRIAERHAVIVVGLRPRPQHAGWQMARWQRGELADRRLAAGDILLVQGDVDAIRDAQRDGVGLLLDQRFALPRADMAPLALLTLAGVVLLAATKTLPIALAATLGALVLVLGRCLSWTDITTALSSKVVLLVAASLALGDALQLTGATDWLGAQLADALRGMRPALVATLLMGLMGIVTNFVSNNAAAAIGTPLAVALATSLGVAPEPIVLAVLFGCNLCYLTPMGYQTNLLVMNAAGYRFGDFLRVGGPLFLIMWGGLSALLAWRYGL